MNTCAKCGNLKEMFMKYWRSRTEMGCSAGSACPKCEPHRVGIEEPPLWWTANFERARAKATPTAAP